MVCARSSGSVGSNKASVSSKRVDTSGSFVRPSLAHGHDQEGQDQPVAESVRNHGRYEAPPPFAHQAKREGQAHQDGHGFQTLRLDHGEEEAGERATKKDAQNQAESGTNFPQVAIEHAAKHGLLDEGGD